jgi:metal-dependent hydrolase (beta-lactamase superfamily II)
MMQPSIGRRRFMRSAAATGSFLACYGVVDRSQAQVPVRITPPVVDKLTIQAVVDTNHDSFISGAPVDGVGIERARSPAAFNGKALDSQWGLSLHMVSTKSKNTRLYSLDFAFTPEVLNNNLSPLKIDPAALDALILSHGHLDHFGGLMGFLQANRAKMREDLLLYVGGEDTFCHRMQRQADGSFAPYGVLDRHDLKPLKVQPVLSELPMIIEEHAFTTGIVRAPASKRCCRILSWCSDSRMASAAIRSSMATTIISAPTKWPANRCLISIGTSTRRASRSATAALWSSPPAGTAASSIPSSVRKTSPAWKKSMRCAADSIWRRRRRSIWTRS